jgi:hypothetical protein
MTRQGIYKMLWGLEKKGLIFRDDPNKFTGIGSVPSDNARDKFRLHNIELLIRCNKEVVELIKRRVKDGTMNYHTKSFFFKRDEITYMITNKNNLYAFFPKEHDIIAEDIPGQYKKLDIEYRLKIALPLGKEFKQVFYKKGRKNYTIVNRHQALMNNGVASEIKREGLSKKVRVEDPDGRTAYMFDFSKGICEWESPHPEKADHYILLAKRAMSFISCRNFEGIIRNHEKYMDFFKDYDRFKEEHSMLKQSSLMFLEGQMRGIADNEGKPNYIG